MTNITAIFSSFKNAPTQKPLHLLISVQILDEGNNHSLTALYLFDISALHTLIPLCHKYWKPALYLIDVITLQTLICPCHN